MDSQLNTVLTKSLGWFCLTTRQKQNLNTGTDDLWGSCPSGQAQGPRVSRKRARAICPRLGNLQTCMWSLRKEGAHHY